MTFKQLELKNIRPKLLNKFDRYQKVTTLCIKKEEEWVLEDTLEIRDWDFYTKKWAIQNFIDCIKDGGIVIGVFDGKDMIGFAQLDKELLGSVKQYVNLNLFLISNGYRNKGIGGLLFKEACEAAIKLGGKRLYVSAYSAEDTIHFYKKQGCVDAKEIFEKIKDKTNDWQCEYELSSL